MKHDVFRMKMIMIILNIRLWQIDVEVKEVGLNHPIIYSLKRLVMYMTTIMRLDEKKMIERKQT